MSTWFFVRIFFVRIFFVREPFELEHTHVESRISFVRADHRKVQDLKGGGASQVWVGGVCVECGPRREGWDTAAISRGGTDLGGVFGRRHLLAGKPV